MQCVQFSSKVRNKGLKLQRRLGKTVQKFGRKIANRLSEWVEKLGLIPQVSQQPALAPVRVRGKSSQSAASKQPW